jgi:hypothetical protein
MPGSGGLDREGETMSDSPSPQENPAKDPADWTTGGDPMTGRSIILTGTRSQ